MTLSTDIYVDNPVDPAQIFDMAYTFVVAEYEGEVRGDVLDFRWEKKDHYSRDGAFIYHTIPGQGLPAWLSVYYREGGPFVSKESARVCGEDCDPDFNSHYHDVPNYLIINFDTAYGYSDSKGRNASQLHAYLITKIGQELQKKGIAFRWHNEFTGDIYEGFEGLETLVGEGGRADEWFTNSVLPVIGSFGGQDGYR